MVRFWDFAPNSPPSRHSGELTVGAEVTMLALSPGEEHLAVSTNNGTAVVYATATCQKILEYQYTQSVGDASDGLFIATSCCFSVDGQNLFVTGGRSLRSVSLKTGQVKKEYIGPDGWSHSARCSLDGKKVLAASDDASIWIWDIHSGEPIRTLRGHKDMIHTASFSPRSFPEVSTRQPGSGRSKPDASYSNSKATPTASMRPPFRQPKPK